MQCLRRALVVEKYTKPCTKPGNTMCADVKTHSSSPKRDDYRSLSMTAEGSVNMSHSHLTKTSGYQSLLVRATGSVVSLTFACPACQSRQRVENTRVSQCIPEFACFCHSSAAILNQPPLSKSSMVNMQIPRTMWHTLVHIMHTFLRMLQYL